MSRLGQILCWLMFATCGLIACSGDSASTSQIIEEEEEKIVEIQSNSGRLVIYSGRSESLVAPIIAQFAQNTGISVKVKYAKTSSLANLLLEEGSKTPADIFFAQEPGGLGAVENLLGALSPTTLALVPDWGKSLHGKWVGVSGRARTVVYNNKKVHESDLPDDMWGFTDSKWKGKIGWAPTNASFQTMVSGMRTIWGEDLTRKWLIEIQANEPKVYPNNTPQVAAVAAEEIEVGFVNHYYLHRFLATEGEGFAARNYHPRSGGPGSLILVSGVGILEAGTNKENSQKFIDFILSPVAQQYFANQTFEYPLIEAVKANQILMPLAEIKKPDITLKDLADLDGTVKLLRETGLLP